MLLQKYEMNLSTASKMPETIPSNGKEKNTENSSGPLFQSHVFLWPLGQKQPLHYVGEDSQ